MPHLAVMMLPGRNRDVKGILAEKIRDKLIEILRVESKFISVSIEDVEIKNWGSLTRHIPEEYMIINSKNE